MNDMAKIWCCADAAPEAQLAEIFKDNVRGQCAICGRDIMWRPHADPDSTKVCIPCTAVLGGALTRAGDTPKVMVTETCADEFEAVYGFDGRDFAAKTFRKMFEDYE